MRKFYLLALASSTALASFMSEVVPTVMIKGKDGKPLRINESEYNEEEHGKQVDAKGDEGLPMTPTAFLSAPHNPIVQPLSASTPVATEEDRQRLPAPILNGDTPVAVAPGGGDRPVMLTESKEPTGGATPAAVAAPDTATQYTVAQLGSKHFVMDAAGNKIDDGRVNKSGYKSAAEAWAAVKPAAS